VVVTATEIPEQGRRVEGLMIRSVPVMESLIHKEKPLDNAMYYFDLAGIRIAHMGDAGNRLTDEQLRALAGTDILLALSGGPPTIDLGDLYDAITVIRPRVVIPMHYGVPGCKVRMLPVTDLTKLFPAEDVEFTGQSEIAFTPETLPERTRIVVLEPSTTGIRHPEATVERVS
jgi:L-ascorbate metabolism protein UlaG (beta-lactamase superfamily)